MPFPDLVRFWGEKTTKPQEKYLPLFTVVKFTFCRPPTYPPLNSNMICESSLSETYKELACCPHGKILTNVKYKAVYIVFRASNKAFRINLWEKNCNASNSTNASVLIEVWGKSVATIFCELFGSLLFLVCVSWLINGTIGRIRRSKYIVCAATTTAAAF